jgi:hypothetical protein
MSISAKLAAELLAMAIRFSGLQGMPPEQLPFFEPMTAAQLEITQCRYVATGCDGLVAVYDHENYTIIYLDTFDENDPEDNSFIVHEMVHVLQYRDNRVPHPMTCRDISRLENQAYSAQNAYLRYMGSSSRWGRSESSTTCQGKY